VDSFIFGIVDQSPIRQEGSAEDALRETVELAKLADIWGYKRYWVAEHHNSDGYAGTAPEILISQIAANTKNIIIGSGGVMLSHYSALKVAETFRILNSFYPDRIELGIGRAPGSDHQTAAALAYPRPQMDINQFPQQVADLIGFMSGTLHDDHYFSNIKAQPGPSPNSIPNIWLLGSSDFSARLAAALGLPFSFADFFGTSAEHGPMIVDLYRQQFQPSNYCSEPKVNVALQVICSETQSEADFIASSRDIARINRLKGIRGPMMKPEEASKIQFSPQELYHLEQTGKHIIQGDPQYVKAGILDASARYHTNEISIVTNCYYFDHRTTSFKLISEIFGLNHSSSESSFTT
jgi:luciferase family oxidoreductase group 1